LCNCISIGTAPTSIPKTFPWRNTTTTIIRTRKHTTSQTNLESERKQINSTKAKTKFVAAKGGPVKFNSAPTVTSPYNTSSIVIILVLGGFIFIFVASVFVYIYKKRKSQTRESNEEDKTKMKQVPNTMMELLVQI
jgi:beta-lactamase regulating signal transducer with metallopeptidase domain